LPASHSVGCARLNGLGRFEQLGLVFDVRQGFTPETINAGIGNSTLSPLV
jgi:hypothetical protein